MTNVRMHGTGVDRCRDRRVRIRHGFLRSSLYIARRVFLEPGHAGVVVALAVVRHLSTGPARAGDEGGGTEATPVAPRRVLITQMHLPLLAARMGLNRNYTGHRIEQ